MIYSASINLEKFEIAIKNYVNKLPNIEIGPQSERRLQGRNKVGSLGAGIQVRQKRGVVLTTNSEVMEATDKKFKIWETSLKNKDFLSKVVNVFSFLWENQKERANAQMNTLKSFITQPMLKGEYGFQLKVFREKTNPETFFKRKTIDTGQLYSSIKANFSKVSKAGK